MNPNSAHQIWSRWTVRVVLRYRRAHDDPRFVRCVELEHAHLLRHLFGMTGAGRVERQVGVADQRRVVEVWILDARVEGHPVHDPAYRARLVERLRAHYAQGFGPAAAITVDAQLEAGDAQDGRPAAQLLLLPTLSLHDEETDVIHGH